MADMKVREIAKFLQRHPGWLDSIRFEDLRPDLDPFDQVLAEMLLVRDRLQGIAIPRIEAGKRSAGK